MTTTANERPTWWKRHYQMLDDDDVSNFTSPHLQAPPRRRPSSYQHENIASPRQRGLGVSLDPELFSADKGKDSENVSTKHKTERLSTYRGIVETVRKNDMLAKDYTGSEYHSQDLLHPSLWFHAEEKGTDLGDSVLDSFWINKNLYMHNKKAPAAKFTRDQILAMKIAREAKEMNMKMTQSYDTQRQRILSKEERIAENNRVITKLKQRIEDTEKQSKMFEKSFNEANEAALGKLEVIRKEEKHVNDSLLREYQKPKMRPPFHIPSLTNRSAFLSDVPPHLFSQQATRPLVPTHPDMLHSSMMYPHFYQEPFFVPLLLESERDYSAPDPVWRRTGSVLETDEDMLRKLRYQAAIEGVYWR